LRRVLLITIDGWGTNLVGCYGNALCSTPNLDRIAAKSIVFDRCWTSSSNLAEVITSIATGRHPLNRCEGEQEWGFGSLGVNGKRSLFITDDPELVELSALDALDEVLLIEPSPRLTDSDSSIASSWTETRLAHFIESALEELSRLSEAPDGIPELVWLHMSGLTYIWDAPEELRTLLCDPEVDPEPPKDLEPIAFTIDESTDMDRVFGATCVAAAQGIVIDEVLGWVEAFLDQLPDAEDCLLALIGTRGYPLGEHYSVGYASSSPFSELVHIPLIVQTRPSCLGSRDPRLVQPMSATTSVLEWLQDDGEEDVRNRDVLHPIPVYPSLLAEEMESSSPDLDSSSEVSFVGVGESIAIQIARWSMVLEPNQSTDNLSSPENQLVRLYLCPDDRWQQNNVVTRASDVAETLTTFAFAYRDWLTAGSQIESRPHMNECLHWKV
jgi:hypothetical protein